MENVVRDDLVGEVTAVADLNQRGPAGKDAEARAVEEDDDEISIIEERVNPKTAMTPNPSVEEVKPVIDDGDDDIMIIEEKISATCTTAVVKQEEPFTLPDNAAVECDSTAVPRAAGKEIVDYNLASVEVPSSPPRLLLLSVGEEEATVERTGAQEPHHAVSSVVDQRSNEGVEHGEASTLGEEIDTHDGLEKVMGLSPFSNYGSV
jgi:hypothetical protein